MYCPEVYLSKSATDPTRLAVAFNATVPTWVTGYIEAVVARNFQLAADLDTRQTNQLLMNATKELNQVLENLVNAGLVFSVGGSDTFKSAGE